jgi:hypothetical protein
MTLAMSEDEKIQPSFQHFFAPKEEFKTAHGRFLLHFQKHDPAKTYDEILTAIGIGKILLRPDFKSQIITMLKEEAFSKYEQYNKVFWQAPYLNVWSLNMNISMRDKEEDGVLVSLTYCFVATDLNAEWFWTRRSKANKCQEIVNQCLDELLAGRDSDHLKFFNMSILKRLTESFIF